MSECSLQQVIENKREGLELKDEDISCLVNVATKLARKEAGDKEKQLTCQIGALLMAIYLKGLNDSETNLLTLKMRDSGKVFQWSSSEQARVVDKHSTGGVGDKISLILAPALAACRLLVPMISGRSLGHTGGTLDKLEAIKNLRVSQSDASIRRAISDVGCCIVSQTEDCVPADKVLYESRDITCTVNYPPLIIASIASKKLSENLAALVYDVKFGKGSFFKTKEDAIETAKGLVKASRPVKTVAFLTSMEAPLGKAIGDELEVLEAIECLKGKGPEDVMQLVRVFGNELCSLTNNDTRYKIDESIKDGSALRKFHDMLIQQNVDAEIANELCYGDVNKAMKFSSQINTTEIIYEGSKGYIESIDPMILGRVWKNEYILSEKNQRVGFRLKKSIEDEINDGEVWLQFFHFQKEVSSDILKILKNAITVSQKRKARKLIFNKIYMKNDCAVVEDL